MMKKALIITIVLVVGIVAFTVATMPEAEIEESTMSSTATGGNVTYIATDKWTDNTTGNMTYWLELNHTKVLEIDWRWHNLIDVGDLVTLDENDNITAIFPWKY